MSSTSNPVALVTGASRGIGRAISTLLQESGYRVFGTSRDPLRAASASFPMLTLDVCDTASVQRCLHQVGDVDVLINNAGYAFVGAVEETSIDEARKQMETNCFGALRMMHAVLPGMRARGGGRIVSISSISGIMPPPFLSAYAASKHAMEAFTESLSFEARPFGIRAAIVEFDSMRTGIEFSYPTQLVEAYAGPRGRMIERLVRGSQTSGADPDLVAQTVLQILNSDDESLRWTVGNDTAHLVRARALMPQTEFAQMARHQLGLWN